MKKYPEYKNLDLVKIAEEILTNWERNDTFKKSINSRSDNPSFTFYEGPPSANGVPQEFIMSWEELLKIFFAGLKP